MVDATLRELIADQVRQLWPSLHDGARWITAQVMQESGGNPNAVSPVGAVGLMQLMPGTAREMGITNPREPVANLRGGITYLRRQYDNLMEVPDSGQRLLWAFASYNGGRGYIDFNGEPSNTALELAQVRHAELVRIGQRPNLRWYDWDFGKQDIARVTFRGKSPDHRQIVGYVTAILRNYHSLVTVR